MAAETNDGVEDSEGSAAITDLESARAKADATLSELRNARLRKATERRLEL